MDAEKGREHEVVAVGCRPSRAAGVTVLRRAKGALSVLRGAIDGFARDDCATLAAGLAFYTLFSLAPLLLIVMNLTALIVDPESVAEYIVQQAGSLIGAAGAEQVHTVLETTSRQGREGGVLASVTGGLVAVLGASTVLVQLQRALNRVWQVHQVPGLNLSGFLLKRLISLAMMAIIAFLLVVSLFASAVLGAASSWLAGRLPEPLGTPSATLIDLVVSLLVFAAVFSSMFKFLPDATIEWRQVALGGVVTAVLFVIGKTLIGRYLGASAVATFYGAAGSLAVVLVWVYYNAILVLFGAELTRSWTVYHGARVRPAAYAVRDGVSEPGQSAPILH
jgi:membrane protein